MENHNNQIEVGLGNMPKVVLEAPDGARAEIYLHGAHVTSWIPAGGSECLFLSKRSVYKPGTAIRGGVPIIFPQFGVLGELPRHGFARTLIWDFISLSGDAQSATAKFMLQDNQFTRSIWPYAFRAEYQVMVFGGKMRLTLIVSNPGDTLFAFTCALHTYLKTIDIRETFIDGLSGTRYHDTVNRATPADWIEKYETDSQVRFPGEIDRVYYDIHPPLSVCQPGRITKVSSIGFPDDVIWNPGPEKSAKLSDMEPDGYCHMVCVEAAIVGDPVQLDPGSTWKGSQTIST